MSRSGYRDDCDYNVLNLYRGTVARTIQGERGQAFLREMRDALDAMPEKTLIADDLVKDGEVCALGCVAVRRGIDVSKIDPEDFGAVAAAFGISETLAREIENVNDDDYPQRGVTPEQRYERVRKWVARQIKEPAP